MSPFWSQLASIRIPGDVCGFNVGPFMAMANALLSTSSYLEGRHCELARCRGVQTAAETITTRYFHTDHLGSISAITNESEVVQEGLS